MKGWKWKGKKRDQILDTRKEAGSRFAAMSSLELAANSSKQRWSWECAAQVWPLGVSVYIFFKLINFTEKPKFVTFSKKTRRLGSLEPSRQHDSG